MKIALFALSLAAAGAQAAPWCPAPATPQSAAAAIRHASGHLQDTPKARARLHTEGTLPHQGIYDASRDAAQDLPLLRDFALAWRASGDPTYLAATERFLQAWTQTYQPSFNPIDETGFDALIDAYVITRPALSAATRAQTERWLRRLAEGYIDRIETNRKPSGTWINNWNSHRIKLIELAAVALQDTELQHEARKLYLAHITRNIGADGQVMDFAERDALHYVTYDLEPLLRAALAAQSTGDSWLELKGPAGGNLKQALDWLLPYANGEKTHQEFVGSKVKFDAARREAGLPGYEGQWQPANARYTYALAARLAPGYQAISQQLGPSQPWVGACWP